MTEDPAVAAAAAAVDDVPEERRDKKEKKHKHKEKKKHKHKHKERHRSRTRSRTPAGGHDSSDEEAGVAADAVQTAALPGDEVEGRGGAAPEPAAPLAGATKPAAATATATAAGADDAEEGELPEQAPVEDGGRLEEQNGQRRRSRSPNQRHPSASRGAARSRSRDQRRSRSRSPAVERSRRDASERPPLQRSHDTAAGRDRDSRDARPRSRSAGRRRSRSPARRQRSASPPPRDRDRAMPPLPPRDRDYRRDLDRRNDRRPDYGRDRFGGRPDDRRRLDERRPGRSRSRSRERSRDVRKRSRSRSGDRSRRDRQQQQDEDADEGFQARVAAALEQQEDEDRLIEERRRRRQAILAKHRSAQSLDSMAAAPTATQLAQQQEQQGAPPASPQQAQGQGVSAPLSAAGTPQRVPSRAAGEEGEPDLSDNEDDIMAQLGTTQAGALDIFRHDGGDAAGAPPAGDAPASGTGEALDSELRKRLAARAAAEPDMFADDDADDIFAATPADVKAKEAAASAAQAGVAAPPAVRKGLLDNYDDAEGYYNFQVGEIIGEAGGPQFEVYATHGKGVFSSVLRARDLGAARDPGTGAVPEVAIKVIRANETMYKAGQMERVILRKLSEADPEGRRHCIRMLGSFEYRNHLCLVFEAMDMNLRELTKRYGRGIGLSISAVRAYAQQMLVSLYHLRNCGVLHADIKPDNILVNDRRTVVKLCDFGSAMFAGDNEITPYLVSRFYRAPEVILGLPYDHPLDMWSIGCVVYELFTGHILFPGKTNNEMLKLMMDVKGPFPKKMLKRAEFAFKHFEADPNMSFALLEEDAVTKRPVRRLIPNPTVKKDFAALLAGQSPDKRKLAQLVDLLERMMQLDPDKRITPKDALRHPFIKDPPTIK